MSFLFLITLLNIMPNRLLLLILPCLFWVNQISWCQICAIWHLLLLANYWRKDKLVMVHTAISSSCGRGTGSTATKYSTHSRDWGWGSRMGQKPRGSTREAAWGARGRGTWPGAWWGGCAGSTWCIQQIRLGCFTDGVRQSKGSEKLQPNPDKIEKSLLISKLICVFHYLMVSHLH